MIKLDKILRTYAKSSENVKALKIVSNLIYDEVTNITVDGIVKEHLFDDRYYLHTIPRISIIHTT